MKSTRFIAQLLLTFAAGVLLLCSCSKNETGEEPLSLTVSLPRAVLHNEAYYSLGYRERSIELDFSEALDTATISGQISLSDRTGALDAAYGTIASGKKVILALHTGFYLREGWRYLLTIGTGLRSTAGKTLPTVTTLEIRTTSGLLAEENDTTGRNSILCISDIHMGEARAATMGYCWFSKNAAALESLLDLALTSPQIRQVVILGDMFDEWIVPYRLLPFDTVDGIRNSADYFKSVANSPVNANVIARLKAIASGGIVQLVYVPGNHDMLLTEEILREIIPGVIWKGDVPGLGHYSPLDEIIMEHGHRYDFFNAPQPLCQPGHMLPPGYFISRLDAEGLMEQRNKGTREQGSVHGSAEFIAAWTVSFTYLEVKYGMTVAPDSLNIMMNGIDGYSACMSFNGVRDMYAANIEEMWASTQSGNSVPVAMPVAMAILNGNLDLSFNAAYQYMQSVAPKKYKIVVFGHTHQPMLSVWPAGSNYTGIYANTGSWVNEELSSKAVRTFILLQPGTWTGSDLDVVSLYQYNLDSGSGDPTPGYVPVLISEESIAR